jgi:hypothetical protein
MKFAKEKHEEEREEITAANTTINQAFSKIFKFY